MDSSLIHQVEEIIGPIVREEGLELLEVVWTSEHGNKILRVLVEKEDGPVNMEDLSRASHSIEDVLEVKNLIPTRYNLEVSSPGVNRPLKKKPHFEKAVGRNVKVQTKAPIEGRRNYKGLLKQVQEEELVVEIDKKDYVIPIREIAKANLECF